MPTPGLNTVNLPAYNTPGFVNGRIIIVVGKNSASSIKVYMGSGTANLVGIVTGEKAVIFVAADDGDKPTVTTENPTPNATSGTWIPVSGL